MAVRDLLGSLLLAGCLLTAAPAGADFRKGLQALHANDYPTAFVEWEASAASEPAAFYGLGYLFLMGIGVPQQDAALGHAYLTLALIGGYLPAGPSLASLTLLMKPEALLRARQELEYLSVLYRVALPQIVDLPPPGTTPPELASLSPLSAAAASAPAPAPASFPPPSNTGGASSAHPSAGHAMGGGGMATDPAMAAGRHGARSETPSAVAEAAPVLRIGDLLRIFVVDRLDMSGDFTIDPNGTVLLPELGRFPAAGMTTEEFRTSLGRHLVNSAGRPAMVQAQRIETGPIFVVGAVKRPGRHPFTRGMVAGNGIALAGGYKSRAQSKQLTVIRAADPTRQEVRAGQSTPLQPGDVVVVRDLPGTG